MTALLRIIPTFIILSTFTLILYNSEREVIAIASEKADFKTCDLNKREYFKNICISNVNSVANEKQVIPKIAVKSYLLLAFEFLINTYFALFFLGLAYWNGLERFIEHQFLGKFVYYYRKIQEENMLIIPRFVFVMITWSVFVYVENLILN